jgi:AbiV family abortive infection protein
MLFGFMPIPFSSTLKSSFASAFALSVLANEEFGKGFAIAEICFQAKFENRLGAEDEKTLKALLSDHKLKQGWFRSYVFGGVLTPKGFIKHFERIQADKNNAFYVGVRSGNHQIIRPFLLSKTKARKQLRITNGALLRMVDGTLSGREYHEEVLDDLLRSRRVVKELRRATELLK